MFEPLFQLLGSAPSMLLLGGTLSLWAVVTGAVFVGPSKCPELLLRDQGV